MARKRETHEPKKTTCPDTAKAISYPTLIPRILDTL